MILSVLEKINACSELFFSPFDKLIKNIPLDDWVLDAIIDSVHLLPFLFLIIQELLITHLTLPSSFSTTVKEILPSSINISFPILISSKNSGQFT